MRIIIELRKPKGFKTFTGVDKMFFNKKHKEYTLLSREGKVMFRSHIKHVAEVRLGRTV